MPSAAACASPDPVGPPGPRRGGLRVPHGCAAAVDRERPMDRGAAGKRWPSGVERANREIPAGWREVIERVMAPLSQERWADARRMREAIATLVDGERGGVSAPGTGDREPPTRHDAKIEITSWRLGGSSLSAYFCAPASCAAVRHVAWCWNARTTSIPPSGRFSHPRASAHVSGCRDERQSLRGIAREDRSSERKDRSVRRSDRPASRSDRRR